MVDETHIATIELRQLRHVLSLNRFGNFRRAAEEQCITQPALTKSIQSLEHKLNETLFIRQSTGVVTTKSGQVVVQYAQKTVSLLREMIHSLKKPADKNNIDIVLGVDSYIGEWIVNNALKAILKQCPELKIKTLHETADNLQQGICSNLISFVVSTESEKKGYSNQHRKKLPPQKSVIYARSGHPLQHKKIVSCNDLLQYSFAGLALPDAIVCWLSNMLPWHLSGEDTISHIYCASYALSNIYIRNTDCWGCAPLNMVSDQITDNIFTALPVENFCHTVQPWLISSTQSENTPAGKFVAGQIMQSAQI